MALTALRREVAAYNDALDQYKRGVQSYNSATSKYNTAVDAYNQSFVGGADSPAQYGTSKGGFLVLKAGSGPNGIASNQYTKTAGTAGASYYAVPAGNGNYVLRSGANMYVDKPVLTATQPVSPGAAPELTPAQQRGVNAPSLADQVRLAGMQLATGSAGLINNARQ